MACGSPIGERRRAAPPRTRLTTKRSKTNASPQSRASSFAARASRSSRSCAISRRRSSSSGAIETTEAKAKELRPFVEKLITKARNGTLHARRLAGRHVQKRAAADKLFQELGPRFAKRTGGYTRILKTGHRKGDGAEMARIELIEG